MWSIAGFHTIIKTIRQIKWRIKETKEDKYSNSLAKIQVCAMFHAGDIWNVLLTFLRLCMETACLCPSEGHKYGGQKQTKNMSEFSYKKPVVVIWRLINIYMSTYSHTRNVQIAKSQWIGHFFKPTWQHSAWATILIAPFNVKAQKFNLALWKDEKPYQTENL